MKKYNSTPTETPHIWEQIQERADYHFKDLGLLREALTHSSYVSEQKEPIQSNQRLEFLGDSVLQIIVSELIFKQFPDQQEGNLSKLRSHLTDEPANVSYTQQLQLDLGLMLGKGDAASGGRSRPTTLGDLFEAFLGAIYLDGGLEEARRVCLSVLPDVKQKLEELLSPVGSDVKGTLQNICQGRLHQRISYVLLESSGPSHRPVFTSAVMMDGHEIGRGTANSKKESEKLAAKDALCRLAPEAVPASSPRELPPPSSQAHKFTTQKRLLALDFDGVICDSAAETAISGWKAAMTLWPQEFRDSQPPTEIIEHFRRIRPYLETGYQSILMLKMLLDGATDDAFKNDLQDKLALLMEDFHLTKSTLVAVFGKTRDNWIQSDLNSWLAPQNPYPGTIEALKLSLQRHNVLILTTKQERFVKAWLTHFGVDFPVEDIIGLDRKIPKEDTLAQLVNDNKKNIHFVEDRLQTLLRVEALPNLKRVKLHYANWGYGTPEEIATVQNHKSIDVIGLSDFIDLLS